MTRLDVPALGRRLLIAAAILLLLYAALGVAFHVAWKGAQAACREAQAARGEFVEPEVFGSGLGLMFDVTFWPVYAYWNTYHFGSPLGRQCER
ncbi:MAG: hypothetical protein Kow00123_15480 [Anaerolineales bacterium]